VREATRAGRSGGREFLQEEARVSREPLVTRPMLFYLGGHDCLETSMITTLAFKRWRPALNSRAVHFIFHQVTC